MSALLAYGGAERCFPADPDERQATAERIESSVQQLAEDTERNRQHRIDVVIAALPSDVPLAYRQRVAVDVIDALDVDRLRYADPWQQP